MEKRFEIRQRETGLVIESENTISEAVKTINQYEIEDENNGEYEEDYYEVYDNQEERVLENTDLIIK